jgi:chorismate dehydratase
MSRPVDIVGVRFLNARPLLAGLEAGIDAPFPYRFHTREPSACAEALGDARAAAGLIPVAALPYLSHVRALPELGVAARREVTSVLLVTKVPLARIRVLTAHTASRTSVALARLLLAHRWAAHPTVVPGRPPLDAMLADADAAVIIGDPALAVRGRSGLAEVDLAAAWVEWTGMPFVFAVWGVAPDAPREIATLFSESLAFAEAHWEELVSRWAAAHGVEPARTQRYLTQALIHRLGSEERAGMELFLQRAATAGLLPERREVWCDG